MFHVKQTAVASFLTLHFILVLHSILVLYSILAPYSILVPHFINFQMVKVNLNCSTRHLSHFSLECFT